MNPQFRDALTDLNPSSQKHTPNKQNRNRLQSGMSTETDTPEQSFDGEFEPVSNLVTASGGKKMSGKKGSGFEIDVKPKKKNFTSQEEKRKFVEEYTKKKKTEMCKNWETKGWCKFGDKCSFAHGSDELKGKSHLHSNYKTKPCKKYFYNGYCNYGNRCQYLHSDLLTKKNFRDFAEKVYKQKNLYLPAFNQCQDYKMRWQNISYYLRQKAKGLYDDAVLLNIRKRLPIFTKTTQDSLPKNYFDLLYPKLPNILKDEEINKYSSQIPHISERSIEYSQESSQITSMQQFYEYDEKEKWENNQQKFRSGSGNKKKYQQSYQFRSEAKLCVSKIDDTITSDVSLQDSASHQYMMQQQFLSTVLDDYQDKSSNNSSPFKYYEQPITPSQQYTATGYYCDNYCYN